MTTLESGSITLTPTTAPLSSFGEPGKLDTCRRVPHGRHGRVTQPSRCRRHDVLVHRVAEVPVRGVRLDATAGARRSSADVELVLHPVDGVVVVRIARVDRCGVHVADP